jgi:exodeoxyribonuclease VII small subunit
MTKKSFEQAMQQLEKIVQEMESGDLPLEKAVTKFEEGIELTRHCSRILDETEQKINLLMQDRAGNVVRKPFSSEESETDRREES